MPAGIQVPRGLREDSGAKRGQNYVTVFIDMKRRDKPVIFVTEWRGNERVVDADLGGK